MGEAGRHQTGGCLLAPLDPGDSEVGQGWVAVGGNQDVGRLHISVEHAGVVGHAQGPPDLDADLDYLVRRQRARLLHPVVQGSAGAELHHEIGATIIGETPLVDGHDVGMTGDGSKGIALAFEAHPCLFIASRGP